MGFASWIPLKSYLYRETRCLFKWIYAGLSWETCRTLFLLFIETVVINRQGGYFKMRPVWSLEPGQLHVYM